MYVTGLPTLPADITHDNTRPPSTALDHPSLNCVALELELEHRY